jgi:DNA-binding transcriptional regulator YdaS (Cro superfamily)
MSDTLSATLSPREALEKAIDAGGGLTGLARIIGVKTPSVDGWRERGVPPKRVLAVEAATGVSRHLLRPDIYPRPESVGEPAEAPQ